MQNFRSIKDIQKKVKSQNRSNQKNKDNEAFINSNKKINDEKNEMRPFFLLTLENGNGQQKQIKILEDSNPSKLAFNFCLENSMDFDTMEYLKNCIKKILNKFKTQKLDEISDNKEKINISFSSGINEIEDESESYHNNKINEKISNKILPSGSLRNSPLSYDIDETLANKTNINDDKSKKYKYDILDYDINNIIDNDEESVTEKGVPILNDKIKKNNKQILAYENINEFDNVHNFNSLTHKNSFNENSNGKIYTSKKTKDVLISKNKNRSLNFSKFTSSGVSRNNEIYNRNVSKTSSINNSKFKTATVNDCFYNTVKNGNKKIYWKKNGYEEKNNTQFSQYNTNRIDKKPKTAFQLSLNVYKYNKRSLNNSKNNIFIKTENSKYTKHNNCNSLNISVNMTKNFIKKINKKDNDESEEHSGIIMKPKYSGLVSRNSLPHNYEKKKINCTQDFTNRIKTKFKSSKNSSRSIMIKKNFINFDKNKLTDIKNGNNQLLEDDYLIDKKLVLFSDRNNNYLYKNNETDVNHKKMSSQNSNRIIESQLFKDDLNNNLIYSSNKFKTNNNNLAYKENTDKNLNTYQIKNNIYLNNNTTMVNNHILYKNVNIPFCKNQIIRKKNMKFKNSSNACTQKAFLTDNGCTNLNNEQFKYNSNSKTDIFNNSQSKIIYGSDKKFKKKIALNNNIRKKTEINNQKVEKNYENLEIDDSNKISTDQEVYFNPNKNHILNYKNNQKKIKKSANCLSSICQAKHRNIFYSDQINMNGGEELHALTKRTENIKNINSIEDRQNTFSNTSHITNNMLLKYKNQSHGGISNELKQINLSRHPVYNNLLHNKRISNSSFTVNNFHDPNHINNLSMQRRKNYKLLKINTKDENKINNTNNYFSMKEDDSVQLITENNKINILNKIFSLFDKDKDGIICFNDNEIYQQLQIFPEDLKNILLNLIDFLLNDSNNNRMYLFPLNRTEFIDLMMFYLNNLKNDEQKLLFSSENKLNELIKMDLFEYYKPKSTYNKFKKDIKI